MSGDFAEFLGQLPPAVILTFLGFMALALVSLVLLVASMGRKNDNRRRRTPAPPMQSAVAEAARADLPDLDLLVGGLPAAPPRQSATPASPPAAPPRPAPAAQPAPPAQAGTTAPARPVSGGGEWDLPNFRDFSSEPLKMRGGRPKAPVPEIDLAGAIEAYLQHKLRSAPEFAGRSLHVLPAPGGGVQIEVDGRPYDAVGDIEDVPTRQFIAQAIEEWQSRQ